jgi:hypothetical protein
MTKEVRNAVVSVVAGLLLTVFLVLILPKKADAIPVFSRQYGTSCTTCHSDFPKLNDFGKAFKDAGFKFPKDDETFLKVQPTMLGAPAQKELWPKAVWPGTIPGLPPIGLRYNNFFQVTGKNAGRFPNPAPGPNVPRTDFETGLFSIFTAGNFGSDIAFWVDDDISVAGANSNGGLGDAYLKFVNLGRFAKLPKDSLSLRVGQFELDLPFTVARTYNLSGYDIYDQANIGAMNGMFAQQNVNNGFAFSSAAQGVELSGGHNYGGYHYSLAIVNQNTSGSSNTTAPVPTANGSGFASDSNFKDLYGRLAYRINFERDKASRNDVQAAGPMGPRDHTSLNLGSYYFYGRSVQRFNGAGAVPILTVREPFYRVGGDFNFNYRAFNIYGLYMYGRDHNLLPFDSTGALIPLPLADTFPVGFIKSSPAKFSGGFVQADYLALPWLMATMRWDRVQSRADQINGIDGVTPTSFAAAFDSTRDRFTPGVQFLIHANIKTSFEYQFRPRQYVMLDANGLPVSPFRVNTAVVGLEFVY